MFTLKIELDTTECYDLKGLAALDLRRELRLDDANEIISLCSRVSRTISEPVARKYRRWFAHNNERSIYVSLPQLTALSVKASGEKGLVINPDMPDDEFFRLVDLVYHNTKQ